MNAHDVPVSEGTEGVRIAAIVSRCLHDCVCVCVCASEMMSSENEWLPFIHFCKSESNQKK